MNNCIGLTRTVETATTQSLLPRTPLNSPSSLLNSPYTHYTAATIPLPRSASTLVPLKLRVANPYMQTAPTLDPLLHAMEAQPLSVNRCRLRAPSSRQASPSFVPGAWSLACIEVKFVKRRHDSDHYHSPPPLPTPP